MNTHTAIQTSKIVPNSYPADRPSQSIVDAMVASIKDMGILNPILVRQKGERYEIIPGGGMVRWLAATKLGMDIVPVKVVQLAEMDWGEVAQIDNMRREPISPHERVASLERLIDEFGLDAGDLVMEQLADLREAAASDPELQSRVSSILARCNIDSGIN